MAAFNTPMVLHSNQKYRQITIEIQFVKLKELDLLLIFIDLLGFLEFRLIAVLTEIFRHLLELFYSNHF